MEERASDSDCALIALTAQRVQAMQELLNAHLTTRYRLQPGDRIEEDGTIIRLTATVQTAPIGDSNPVLLPELTPSRVD